MAKSLLPDEITGTYQVEQWHSPAWSKMLVQVLHDFKLLPSSIATTGRKRISDLGRTEENPRGTAPDYSKMNYEELRHLADNSPAADKMSDEEYESLSIELWRKFSVEQGLK